MSLRHFSIAIPLLMVLPVSAQQIEVESFVLDNGMEFLLLPRTEQPNIIAAGWLARVGSVNERPGITGISHFFEHMMFKGTTTIGTSDAERDRSYREEQANLRNQLLDLTWGEQYEHHRRGEIDDPWDEVSDSPAIKELRSRLTNSKEGHKQVIVNNEFDKIYTSAGGSGMNAFTTNDVTFYFISVPSNKFELWAWMESDRLSDSVFREFYAERDVVHEERRLRTESTPTGVFQEQFNAMFWQSSPYSWPVIGWTSDLNSYTMEEAQRYFDIYYQPSNIVGVIVGDFDPDEIKPVIRRYFSRLQAGRHAPPPVVTLEMKQLAQKRMYAECDCQPQIELRYHTVPFAHSDRPALEMMAEILNGRTGRLYKSLIEGKSIASSASASAGGFGAPAKYAGFFSFQSQVKGDALPEDLELAWYEELERLRTEPVPAQELQKVKNRVAADAYRRLESNFFLLLQIGYYEALDGWEHINKDPKRLQAVSADDILRVADTYFERTNQSVAIYNRTADGEPIDEDLLALNPEQQRNVMLMLKQMENYSLPGLLQFRAQMGERLQQIPPQQAEQFKPMLEYLLKKMDERIAELQAAENN